MIFTEVFLRIIEFTDPYCNFIDSELYYNFSTSEKHQMCNEYASINYDYTQPFVLQEPNQTGNHVNINSNGFRGSEIDFNNDNYQIFF